MRTLSVAAALTALAASATAHADGLAQTPFLGINGGSANLAAYLAESRCADPTETDPRGCNSNGGTAVTRLGATPVQWRRCDWGSNGVPFYQCSDQALSDDGQYIVSTFSYSPWRQFTPSRGDGAQVIWTDGMVARFVETRDASSPNATFFAGADCPGGTGWLLVDENLGISSTEWTSEVAYLSATTDRNICPPLAPAFTQWVTLNVGYPFIIAADGWRREDRTVPTIVTEHYDHATPDGSLYMERNLFGQGYGLLRWEAWESIANGQRNVSQDIGQRCPRLSDGPGAPAGMEMYDCRNLTQIIPVYDWTEDDYEWRP